MWRRIDYERHKGILGDDGTVLYIDCGGDCMHFSKLKELYTKGCES